MLKTSTNLHHKFIINIPKIIVNQKAFQGDISDNLGKTGNTDSGEKMRLIYRIGFIMIMCIGTSVFVYPLIHETGHLLAGMMMDFDVVSYSLFPTPYITFLTDGNSMKMFFVSLFSVVLPLVVSLVIPKRNVAVRFFDCALVLLNIVNVIILFIYGVAYMFGISTSENDAGAVLSFSTGDSIVYFFSLSVILVFSIYILVYLKPYESLDRFLTKKKSAGFFLRQKSKVV